MSKWLVATQIAVLIFKFLRLTVAQETPCALIGYPPVTHLRSDHPVHTPFWQGTGFGVAFATFASQELLAFHAELSGSVDNQTIALYITERFETYVKAFRQIRINPILTIRCIDATLLQIYPSLIYLYDVTPTAPYFSAPNYTYSVPIPWPGSIPITHEVPIWARDRDFNDTLTQVNFSIDILSVVSLRATRYDDDYRRVSADFKVDLLLNPEVAAGTYQLILTADDGECRTNAPVTLIVTEAVCKHSTQDPVFGKLGMNTVNFYEGVISSLPSSGDLLELNGQQIAAHHPDPLCHIDISVESDFLEINSEGQIAFNRTVPLEEWKQSKSTLIFQIVATERVSGATQKVPLIICVDFLEGAGQKSAMLQP